MTEEYRSLLEKELNINEKVIIKADGDSMRPFIKPKTDVLIIGKISGPIVKNDIILFYYGDRIVLHRVTAVHGDKLDTRGDNSIRSEKGIDRSDIIGKLTAVIRNNKEINLNSRSWRIKAVFWNCLFPLRCAAKVPHKIISILK